MFVAFQTRLPARVAGLPWLLCALWIAAAAVLPAWSATRTPTGGGDVATVGPKTPVPPARTLWRRIFTCVSAEVVEFSDRPCGPRAAEREMRLLNPGRGEPGAASSTAPTRTAAAPRESPGRDDRESKASDAAAERASTCERLSAAVDALDDRMRAGYSAREAARLWARWREAKARLHEADC